MASQKNISNLARALSTTYTSHSLPPLCPPPPFFSPIRTFFHGNSLCCSHFRPANPPLDKLLRVERQIFLLLREFLADSSLTSVPQTEATTVACSCKEIINKL